MGANRNTLQDPKYINYEIFILAISVFTLINIFLLFLPLQSDIKEVIIAVDNTLSIVFLFDFFLMVRLAPDKWAYIIKGWGWLDFIGSLPFTPFRIARIVRMLRVILRVQEHGPRHIRRALFRAVAASSVLGIIFLTIVAVEYASILVLIFENGAPSATITNASNALWWSYQTITTVGYGDATPVTNAGRIVGVILMTIGVGLFTVFTSFLANAFVAHQRREVDTIGTSWSGSAKGTGRPRRRRSRRVGESSSTQQPPDTSGG